MMVYVTEKDMGKIETFSKHFSKRPNVFLFVYDEHVLYKSWSIRGWKVVYIPQLCADLMAQGVYGDVALDLFRRWLNASR